MSKTILKTAFVSDEIMDYHAKYFARLFQKRGGSDKMERFCSSTYYHFVHNLLTTIPARPLEEAQIGGLLVLRGET